MALAKLARIECAQCRMNGHHCQAQLFVDGVPMCLRCADGIPCYYETAKGSRHPEEQRDPFEGFEMRSGPQLSRANVVVPPIVPDIERSMIRAELRLSTVDDVARRHFLSPCMVSEIAKESRQERFAKTRRQLHADERVERAAAYARELLMREHETRKRNDRVTIAEIQRATAAHFGMDVARLVLPRNFWPIVKARQVAMFLSSRITGESLPHIGAAFGNKHHTTVLHSIRVVEREIERNEGLRRAVHAVAAALGAELKAS